MLDEQSQSSKFYTSFLDDMQFEQNTQTLCKTPLQLLMKKLPVAALFQAHVCTVQVTRSKSVSENITAVWQTTSW